MANVCLSCGTKLPLLGNHGNASQPLCYDCSNKDARCAICTDFFRLGELIKEDNSLICRACIEKKESQGKAGEATEPEDTLPAPDAIDPQIRLRVADTYQRFLNFIIDTALIFMAEFLTFFILAMTMSEAAYTGLTKSIPGIAYFFIFHLPYYVIMESTFGQTVGKMCTGTRVVNRAASRAGFDQILGRTLCRLIPFEFLSAFFGREKMMWHDSLPKTLVISERCANSNKLEKP